MDNFDKLKLIISEYAVGENNQHCLTGTGGNYNHYLFIADKPITFSNDTKSISVNGNELICNPEYIANTSGKEIRAALDGAITTAIKEVGWFSPLSGGGLAGNNPDDIATRGKVANDTVITMRKCSGFKQLIETDKLTDVCASDLIDHLNSVDFPVALFCIRTQLGLDTVVKYALDEHKIVGPFLQKISDYTNTTI